MHSDSELMMTTISGKVTIDVATGILVLPAGDRCLIMVRTSNCALTHFTTGYCILTLTRLEIAYSYRYMIRNGRTDGPVWSVRQTAVYQQMNMKTGRSIWILIQPNESALKRFKSICLATDFVRKPVTPHLVFLNSAVEGWKDFVGNIRASLQTLVQTCFQS